MDRWVGKVAVVTGASSGIGAAIAVDLAKAGVITIGLARRIERVKELVNELPAPYKKNLISHKCDVLSESDITESFQWIEKTYGGVDILINNAGIYRNTQILAEDNSKDLSDTINTNVMGAVFCIREAFRSMKTRETPGHIIIMNSVTGHQIMNFWSTKMNSFNIYPSSKYALTALTEVVRQELLMEKTRIKITSISPGTVQTEIAGIKNLSLYEKIPHLLPEDISQAVLYALGTPERVQVHEIMIRPTGDLF